MTLTIDFDRTVIDTYNPGYNDYAVFILSVIIRFLIVKSFLFIQA
jgi:hypothetical protein